MPAFWRHSSASVKSQKPMLLIGYGTRGSPSESPTLKSKKYCSRSSRMIHKGQTDRLDGANFPILRGMELRGVQQRMLSALLRQPGLVPTVLTTGIRPEDFPEEWSDAFVVATKEPGRGKKIAADPNGDLTIRRLFIQVALLGHGQARQMAKQIVASVQWAQRQGDDRPNGQSTTASLTKSPEKSAQDDVADDDDVNRDHNREPGNHESSDAGAEETRASQDAKARN